MSRFHGSDGIRNKGKATSSPAKDLKRKDVITDARQQTEQAEDLRSSDPGA
jgi:hypothetical protein